MCYYFAQMYEFFFREVVGMQNGIFLKDKSPQKGFVSNFLGAVH